MNDLSIDVRNLGKRYRIDLEEKRHETLTGAFVSWMRSPVDNYRRLKKLSSFDENESGDDVLWALRDVSFKVEHGEKIGIIGRNGSGKSTLLKLLSRITEPTLGYADIQGRVASLLEVGTGFHPELTGRENVYLNATVLGMSKAEVDRKFDEIVAFSGVERFIDTPVKRYSSGMRVRLGFSVAAHLEPDILLVDEVLAVGDVAFQKKCLGKMDDVARSGRTVLFVSHNMAMIQSLCTRGILLEDGKIVHDAPVEEAVRAYMESAEQKAATCILSERADRDGGDVFRFQKVDFLDPEGMEPLGYMASGLPVLIRITYENFSTEVLDNVCAIISFFNGDGAFMFSCTNRLVGKTMSVPPGRGEAYCLIPKWPLTDGRYHYELFANNGKAKKLDFIKEAGVVNVEFGDYYGSGSTRRITPWQGVFVDFDWASAEEMISRIYA